MDKVRATARQLQNDGDMSAGAKAKKIETMLRKAKKANEGKKSVMMAINKGGGARQAAKGDKQGKNAHTKVVDKRLKSDKRGEKNAAKRAKKGSKKGNHGRTAGKQIKNHKKAVKKAGGRKKGKKVKG